jgi:hypothetical protein
MITDMQNMLDAARSEWIWANTKESVNEYAEFREEFYLHSDCDHADLTISCEGNYTAYINGVMVATGQFTDYPERPTYSYVDVAKHLRKGKNVIFVLGYHFGIDHSSHVDSTASLFYAILSGEEILTRLENVKYRISNCYRTGELERLSSQMGFVFEYDASKDDEKMELNYVCGEDWKEITKNNRVDRPAPINRPLSMLELKDPVSMKIVAQGLFFRHGDQEPKTFAQMMQSDFLSARRAWDVFEGIEVEDELMNKPVSIKGQVLERNGAYLIVDLGAEKCGYISLDVEAPQGTIIDIAVGEHLEDMRVRAFIDGRNFASRYICGEGRKLFTHYNNRYAGRFIQIHISPTAGSVKINYVGLIPAEYPVTIAGNFNSSCSLMDRIYEVSRRTLQLCMYEHYEDCPWREQALYANDARNQALMGYYAFGEYDFPKVSFDLLGRSIRKDNYLAITAPSKSLRAIPSFTMVWFMAMDDLLLFSGKECFTKSYFPQMQRMLDSYSESCIDGLLPCPQGDEYWHFYDWAEELSGWGKQGRQVVNFQQFDAPLNLLFVLTLESASRIARSIGNNEIGERYASQAASIKQAINETFWVESRHAYQTYLGKDFAENHFCELVQSLAILSGTADIHQAEILRKQLISDHNGLVETSLSQSFYKYEALCSDINKYGPWVFEAIQKTWSRMLYHGATSFWETIKGHADFGNAGSLCHGWSAIPIYFYQAYLLGIKPIENGFKRFSIAPFTGAVDKCQGRVMTPAGPIDVEWKNMGTKTQIKVTHPKGLEPIIDFQNPKFEWIVGE